ncbi:MAG TPA: hypothetical protein VFV73_24630, partial [Streptosporangiaceae bacterium]|nr:hypothetical protein [Streptosporangiaceae bacterium]
MKVRLAEEMPVFHFDAGIADMAFLVRPGGIDSVMLPVPDSRESGAHRGGACALPGGGDRRRV